MTTATATVRPARPDEHEAVRDLLRVAYLGYAPAFPAEIFQACLADVLDLAAGGRPTTLVAVDGDRIVGTARYYPPGGVDAVRLPADWAWLRAGAVVPGQRRGDIALALIDESARLARADGAAVLSMHTTEHMPATIALCEGHGFQRAPEWDVDGGVHFGLESGQVHLLTYRLDL